MPRMAIWLSIVLTVALAGCIGSSTSTTVATGTAATEPAPTEPAPTEPAPTEPAPTETVSTETAATEPADVQPVVTAVTVPASAKAPAVPAGTVYGEALAGAPRLPVSTVLEQAEAYEGKRVQVAGTVVDVCAKRGCWIAISGDKEFQDLRFKVTDGVIVFPMDARGKHVVAEGTVRRHELSLEQTIGFRQHEAEERGEAFDPASVTEPMIYVMLEGHGAVIGGGQ